MLDAIETMNAALPPIPRAPEADPAFDARALFEQGLAEVRRLAHAQWTDHNTHDPGITMLELLAYALTELAYRHGLPIEDRLADSGTALEAQFHAPAAVLPNRALTGPDWRRLLIDLAGVKNAWIEAVDDALVYADLRRRQLSRTPPAHPDFCTLPLRGLYRARLEFMDTVATPAQRQAVLEAAREAVERARNLCEDFVELRPVRAQYFAVCAELDLEPDADVTEVAARLLFDIGQMLAPPVLNHDLARLRAQGLTLPEILDGPLLANGFITDADLDASSLPAELHLSDVIGVAMDVPGLRAVRTLQLNPVLRPDEDDEDAPDADPTAVVGEPEPLDNGWRVPVRAGRLPRLSLAQGRLVFSKRGLPVQGWNIAAMPVAVAARLAELREEARRRVETPQGTAVPPLPPGRPRPLAAWRSVQLDFPALYGIGEQSLGDRATPQRQAQVLQLQGWLLLFDQLMADQLALLAGARQRLSVAPPALQAVAERFAAMAPEPPHVLANQLVGFDAALPPGANPFTPPGLLAVYPEEGGARGLLDAIESPAEAARRQQRLLDHLLARVAEDFADYAATMASAFGGGTERLIADKCRFLQQVAAVTGERAGAMLQRPPAVDGVWDSDNVSGLERRLAGLLGIADFTRRNLGLIAYETYDEIDKLPDGKEEFRFRIRHSLTHEILLSSSTRYASREAARAEMLRAIARGRGADGYARALARDGRHYFNIVDAGGEVLARRIEYFDSVEAMEAAIALLMQQLNFHHGGEGLYVVELLLLRPQLPGDPLLPICGDPGCADCSEIDPYSYRVQIVLPAYAGRFTDLGFRQFVEQTIRREVPAHILPTVCWISADDMALFEGAWRDWLMLQAGFADGERAAKLQALIDALVGVKNVYPVHGLFDCTGDESKPPFILGKTSLGRGPEA